MENAIIYILLFIVVGICIAYYVFLLICIYGTKKISNKNPAASSSDTGCTNTGKRSIGLQYTKSQNDAVNKTFQIISNLLADLQKSQCSDTSSKQFLELVMVIINNADTKNLKCDDAINQLVDNMDLSDPKLKSKIKTYLKQLFINICDDKNVLDKTKLTNLLKGLYSSICE